MNPVHLDHNATSVVRPQARAAVMAMLDQGGNPSSIHASGRAARRVLEQAREQVSGLISAVAGSVTFTSGGTEANALALHSAVSSGLDRILVGATEHDAVWENAQASGLPVTTLAVNAQGVIDLPALAEALDLPGRALVCLMLANNETGVVHPIAQAADLVRPAGGWLHVDAVQAAGKIGTDFSALGADSLALSAHKLGGPQGVGALVCGTRATLVRRQHGGGQERGRRAGTENLPGIAGFAAASEASLKDLAGWTDQARWRDGLQARLQAAGAVVLGAGAERLPQTLCVAMPGWASETQVMHMDLGGVMISAGAACSSGKVKASRTVAAMGRPDLAACSIRISGGWNSSEADWTRAGDVWLAALEVHLSRQNQVREVA
ncbi:MAG: cysteine desulfurase family protein [Caulobacter sp.]|nr:cysteine desulfurase family protein [Caulobacter sp.]